MQSYYIGIHGLTAAHSLLAPRYAEHTRDVPLPESIRAILNRRHRSPADGHFGPFR